MDFQYLAQALSFSNDTLLKVSKALQDFHDYKDAIVRAGGRRDSWEIPKLELLQSVVPDIRCTGPVMQWSADPTEHAHVQLIKVPAQAGNNQDHYNRIARHLSVLEKCSLFDITTYLERGTVLKYDEDNNRVFDQDPEHEPDSEDIPLHEHLHIPSHTHVDYSVKADALLSGPV